MSGTELLDRLCAACGIGLDWQDIWGNRHEVPDAGRRALLVAMGIPAGSDEDLARALRAREEAPWRRASPPVVVLRETESDQVVPIVVAGNRPDVPVRWTLTEEGGARREGEFQPEGLREMDRRELDGELRLRVAFAVPRLSPGYHTLEVARAGEAASATTLIMAPASCYEPPALVRGGRIWGLALQLYGVRSARNWGMGDFTDLLAVVDLARELGAGVVGVNPLHALYPANPEHTSPYSPSSRLFVNVLYVDPERVPEFAESEAARRALEEPQLQAALRSLRAADLVDYTGVAQAKHAILQILFDEFRQRHRQGAAGAEFRAFVQAGGEHLGRQALYEALQEHFLGVDRGWWGWPVWPEGYRDPASDAVATFAAAHAERIEYFMYLQWQAQRQLAAVGERARALDMAVGLYQDLAVGVDRGGAEAWAAQDAYALQAGVGAPPDDFSPHGQNWGLPPLIPERLRALAYEPFIATLRAAMRSTGALRIDHVMGLMRLFWIPWGMGAENGAYVSYPLHDLLGILALESQRHRCLVIGEDLGTVPEGLRDILAREKIYSYRLLYFEKNADGSFKGPEDYPEQALAAVATHDLPPLSGFWRGADLDVRTELGLFPSDEVRQQQLIARAQDRAQLVVALERQELLPGVTPAQAMAQPEMTPELARALHVALARSRARIVMTQPEDVFGVESQANLPGSTDQHPNWRRKLPVALEEWSRDDRLTQLARALTQERPQSAAGPGQTAAPAVEAIIPRATYRLQFNRQFTFRDAAALVPYLAELGVSHVYASPYLKARPGSLHGYDLVSHNELNPEIGSREDFEVFTAALRAHDMGQILDIVPNHMVIGADNEWWLDVLENGRASAYAPWFDIAWRPIKPELRDKVLVPFLGDPYGTVLERGEIKVAFDEQAGSFAAAYYQHRFPIDPRTYPALLGHGMELLVAALGDEDARLLEFQSLLTAFGHLPERGGSQPETTVERARDKEILKKRLAALCQESPAILNYVRQNVALFNGVPGDPASFDLLHGLLDAQAYRLAFWRTAADEINYRRFFDINELIALRMDNEELFQAAHKLVIELVHQGHVQGLRIDHPDGLFDPVQYFLRVQQAVAGARAVREGTLPVYLVAEKILGRDEELPGTWPLHGSTGYDFANLLNGLFVHAPAEPLLRRVFRRFTGIETEFSQLVYERKKQIMANLLPGELTVLAGQLNRISEAERDTRDFTLYSLRSALAEVVACFPVYRTYVSRDSVSDVDRAHLQAAVDEAKQRARLADTSVFDFVRDVLLMERPDTEDVREAVIQLAMQFQQYTAPVTAKGLEDTSFYVYNVLVSLNEVGGDPGRFGVSVDAFHDANRRRLETWPHAMLATSTHDAKRGEDVRARIDVLSAIPAEWGRRVARWHRMNLGKKRFLDGREAPSRNDEYLFYQTLLGTWPLGEPDAAEMRSFAGRMEQYMLKAAREAKTETSWINNVEPYEQALLTFVRRVLTETQRNAFLDDFVPFQRHLSHFGLLCGLSQTLLKLTVPGVPDIYQGNELWSLNLVDPDNRRAVDFNVRQQALARMRHIAGRPGEERTRAVRALLDTLWDGQAKLFVTWQTLALRSEMRRLFSHGTYRPLAATGQAADHLCAFAREHEEGRVVVVAPRLFHRLMQGEPRLPLGREVWGDTALALPAGRYRNALTGERLDVSDKADGYAAGDVLRMFSVAVLVEGEA